MISLKKMNWTSTQVERFLVQREMRRKALQKNNLVKVKKIIVDSITDHLIEKVSSLKTPKEMFDSLTKLFEGKNIHQKMTLRNKLVIATLNGLPGSWDSFMRGMCARRK